MVKARVRAGFRFEIRVRGDVGMGRVYVRVIVSVRVRVTSSLMDASLALTSSPLDAVHFTLTARVTVQDQ